MQVIGQKVEGGPDAGDVLSSHHVHAHLDELGVDLGRGRRDGSSDRAQIGLGAHVRELRRGSDHVGLVPREPRQSCRGIGSEEVEVLVHACAVSST